MNEAPKSLYLHIPFCERICAYCDFPKILVGSQSEEKYLIRLLQELDSNQIKKDSLDTIYIGGGTPSALSYEGLELLLDTLHSQFPHVKEFTMEANPESLSDEKIELMMKYGVNRISLGVQSSNDEILKKLNRNHSAKEVKDAVERLQHHHFENYNLDFIYGIPGETMEDLNQDLEFAFSLSPKHLSFYSLQIEEGTLFYVKHTKAESDEMMARQYAHILSVLKEHGYYRYEVSNFAKPGYESQHNLTYWHDRGYYACGLGAASYVFDVRRVNTRNFTKYLNCNTEFSEEVIDKKTEEFEYLMLNLRLEKGFELKDFEERFHEDFLSSYSSNIKCVDEYISIADGRFSIRSENLYLMDSILLDLLKED